MKMLYMLILPLSVTWADLTKNAFSDDAMVFDGEEANEISHRRFRSLHHNKYELVGTFSTGRSLTKAAPSAFDVLSNSDPESLSAYQNSFNDPLWKFQWYQQDYRTVDGPVFDHNIVPAQRMGFDGEGITLGILGERLVEGHPDMENRVSGVFNAMKKTKKPAGKKTQPTEKKTQSTEKKTQPTEEKTQPTEKKTQPTEKKTQPTGEKTQPTEKETQPTETKTLTPIANMASKMAGVIAMNANNSRCGAGIAYKAKVIGITVMEGETFDEDDIVKGMEHELISMHIFVDAIRRRHDGMELPFSKEITSGLKSIATKGRDNNGGIYVVGAGDGLGNLDHCGADYVVNSIYTFVIASANKRGLPARYSERCSGILATAYSSYELSVGEGTSYPGVVSIDGGDSCTKDFSGTASSAAIASGIFALTLQANPDLTWRDLMHIVAISSEKAPLWIDVGWEINAAGFWLNNHFGFGLLNAENMVLAASQQWEPVPRMRTCKIQFKNFDALEKGSTSTTKLYVDSCPSLTDAEESVKYIEQVELVTTISYRYRAGISIALTSPKETKATLFEMRANDLSDQGFKNWGMRSLHFWGEQPFGTWVLEVNAFSPSFKTMPAALYTIVRLSQYLMKVGSLGYIGEHIRKAELLIHGTSDMPKHYRQSHPEQRRTYSYSPYHTPYGEFIY